MLTMLHKCDLGKIIEINLMCIGSIIANQLTTFWLVTQI